MSREERREALFNDLREPAIDALQQDYVAERLGQTGLELVEALESSFVLPRQEDQLIMPEEQIYTDNIGIHPILYTEDLPGTSLGAMLRGDNLRDLQSLLSPARFQTLLRQPLEHSLNVSMLDLWSDDHPTGWMRLIPASLKVKNRIGHDDEDYEVYSRPTIFFVRAQLLLGRWKQNMCPALVVHEVDHALKAEHMDENELGPILRDHQDDKRVMRAAVTLERSAYWVIANMLTSPTESAIDFGHLARAIKGLSPEEAAVYIDGHKKRYKGRDRLRERSLSALALSEVFGNGSPIPSDQEIKAYAAIGAIGYI